MFTFLLMKKNWVRRQVNSFVWSRERKRMNIEPVVLQLIIILLFRLSSFANKFESQWNRRNLSKTREGLKQWKRSNEWKTLRFWCEKSSFQRLKSLNSIDNNNPSINKGSEMKWKREKNWLKTQSKGHRSIYDEAKSIRFVVCWAHAVAAIVAATVFLNHHKSHSICAMKFEFNWPFIDWFISLVSPSWQ